MALKMDLYATSPTIDTPKPSRVTIYLEFNSTNFIFPYQCTSLQTNGFEEHP
eukprot:m.151113 g.151113  ORF g.151113 m.151113 type:complete len:52 (-) comp15035_c0_seq4:619-774(-)